MSGKEEELVAAARKGVSGAFEELALPQADRIFSLLAGMAGETDAEDLLQETFLKAYRNIGGFRGGSTFFTWITRIAINTARSHARKKKPVGLGEDGGDGNGAGDPFDRLAGDGGGPVDVLSREEERERVRRSLARLEDDEREILLLREVEELSYGEIAGTLDITEAAVRSRLHRARRRLHDFLGGRVPS
ncbi:MAG: sigma-70 family RNA polymerase sigma factor [Planctomycetes bacterium]|nr:sigma-70 family RNA polymerase sigma factor [Planctomycetota bacterium]